jgi:hypothetical protein
MPCLLQCMRCLLMAACCEPEQGYRTGEGGQQALRLDTYAALPASLCHPAQQMLKKPGSSSRLFTLRSSCCVLLKNAALLPVLAHMPRHPLLPRRRCWAT